MGIWRFSFRCCPFHLQSYCKQNSTIIQAHNKILSSKTSTHFPTWSLPKRDMSISEVELQNQITRLAPPLAEGKHKGEAGRVGIIGGSLEYTGAPYFAGITALKCGADLAYVFCMRDAAAPIKSYSPELIVLPYLDAEDGFFLTTSRLHNIHALVIGPGLGENQKVHSLVVSIIQYVTKNEKMATKISLVFDADGIGLLANNRDLLSNYPGPVYLTPNANEIKKLAVAYLADRRLLDTADDAALAQLAACISPNAVLILKGHKDKIVACGKTYSCSVPGSLRRIGGQGDLLSGSLGVFSYWATLFRQDSDQEHSAPAAVLAGYSACSITRQCSQLAFDAKGRSMITSDMIDQIGNAFIVRFPPH